MRQVPVRVTSLSPSRMQVAGRELEAFRGVGLHRDLVRSRRPVAVHQGRAILESVEADHIGAFQDAGNPVDDLLRRRSCR